MKSNILAAIFVIAALAVRSISGEQVPQFRPATLMAVVTAYSSSRRQTSPHPRITASGKHVFNGVVACPRRFAFGTRVSIEGKVYECQDRLNRKYDNRFDIWRPSTAAARLFGKRQLPVTIVQVPDEQEIPVE
jgi:3D (Asp-Asp-Asp) domain-containing protein